ncbi:MAG: transposase [Candidatus Electrothrix gigas]
MLLVHKIQLKPNKKQEEFFLKSAGVARFAFNWALAEWKKQYEAGEKPNEAKLRKQLNSIKAVEFPWMLEISKTVPQQAIKNVGIAYKNFFRQVKAGEKPGFPRFKKRGISKDSFRPDNGSSKDKDALVISNKKVRIPKIGFVKLAEKLRFNGKIIGSIISRTADRWFISITVDSDTLPHVRKNHGSCGVDVGINCLAALNDGTKYQPAKALKTFEDRLKRQQRILSRRKKGSANRKKSVQKVAKLHYKMRCLRQDVIHKATTDIVLNNDFIAIEDLNVKGMVKNRKLAQAVNDASMSEFHRQLEYKSAMYSGHIHKIDRFFPSTKLCMNCGTTHDMPLNKRVFKCECGVEEDRDIHAAQNILSQAYIEFAA